MITKNKKRNKRNKGFVALMSSIIISVILLLIATNVSLTSFYVRSNILDYELKEKSFALAEACVDIAILKLSTDPTYHPTDESVTVDGDNCIIESVTGSPKIIKTRANFRNYITNLEIEVDSDMSITHFEEK